MASHPTPAAESAPSWIVYCPRCATVLETRVVGDRPRRTCPACGYVHFTDPKVGVGVLVVEDGQLLLVRRRMNPKQGKWSIPAGFLDQGEDPVITAAREAREETGLSVEIDGLVGVYYNLPGEGGASIFILYRARRTGGEVSAGDDADAAAFFDLGALPELAFPSTHEAIRLLREA